MLQDFEEEVWIPSCGFALGLDASLGPVARAISRQVILEDDVEQPVHALDAPMATGASGETFDIERRAGDVIARLEAATIPIFDAIVHLQDRLDVGEARLAGITAIGADPIDDAGGRVSPRLDAAVAFLERCLCDEFGLWRVPEITFDIGFERGLISFEREEIIGAMVDDLVGDFDLATHGVDGDERAVELPGVGELVEQLGDCSDFIGLFRNGKLRQSQPGVGGVGAQRMQRFQPLAFVVGAPRGLAVDGDEVVAIRPERGDPALKTTPEQDRIDTVYEIAQPALAGDAEMEIRKAAQKSKMTVPLRGDLVEIVARTYGCAGHQQKDLGKRIHDAPRLALVGQLGKMLQQQSQPVAGNLLVGKFENQIFHRRAPKAESERQGITSSCQCKIALISR